MAFPQGVYFRATDDQVDPANYDCLAGGTTPGASYPFTTAQGNTVGWETAPSGARDRGGSGAVELRGLHFLTAAAVSNFRIDLPGGGAYNIRAAFGDQGFAATGAKAQFLDNSTVFATPVPAGTSISAGRFLDATGVQHTNQNAWAANNNPLANTFSSAIFRVALGGSTATSPIAAIYIESAGGGGAYTLTAAQGAISLGGQSSGLLLGRKVTAAQGSCSLTGQSVGLKFGRRVSAVPGAFGLAGQAVNLRYSGAAAYVLNAARGLFALSAPAVDFAIGSIWGRAAVDARSWSAATPDTETWGAVAPKGPDWTARTPGPGTWTMISSETEVWTDK